MRCSVASPNFARRLVKLIIPLPDLATIVSLIGSTKTIQGLRVRSEIDQRWTPSFGQFPVTFKVGSGFMIQATCSRSEVDPPADPGSGLGTGGCFAGKPASTFFGAFFFQFAIRFGCTS